MNRNDILKLIEERKSKGELTKDDLFEIGNAHRQLPRKSRSWAWLLGNTGGFPNPEAYRKYVCFRLMQVGELPTKGGEPPHTDSERNELYKERQRLRDERNTINRMLRDESRVERMLEDIAVEARRYPGLPKYEYVPCETCPSTEAVALFSDLHLGMQIYEECNRYDMSIARKRVEKWVRDVTRYCRLHGVKRLNVLNLGDLIAGDIHPTIRVEQEMDVISQVINAQELLAHALCELQKAAPEIVYRSVSDNHSRILPDKSQSIERENFFRLIDAWIETRLEGTNVTFAHDNVSFSTGRFRLMNGKLCMFEHGHNLKPNRAFQDLIGMVREYVHYVFLAHYHSSVQKSFQELTIFVNGSICGTDQYADSIHKYTAPKQTLLIFDGHDGSNVINIGIDLDIRE